MAAGTKCGLSLAAILVLFSPGPGGAATIRVIAYQSVFHDRNRWSDADDVSGDCDDDGDDDGGGGGDNDDDDDHNDKEEDDDVDDEKEDNDDYDDDDDDGGVQDEAALVESLSLVFAN